MIRVNVLPTTPTVIDTDNSIIDLGNMMSRYYHICPYTGQGSVHRHGSEEEDGIYWVFKFETLGYIPHKIGNVLLVSHIIGSNSRTCLPNDLKMIFQISKNMGPQPKLRSMVPYYLIYENLF